MRYSSEGAYQGRTYVQSAKESSELCDSGNGGVSYCWEPGTTMIHNESTYHLLGISGNYGLGMSTEVDNVLYRGRGIF